MTMTKEKQLKLMRKNLMELKTQRDRMLSRSFQNPDGFEARSRVVLAKKYARDIKALQARMAKVGSN